MRLTLFYCPLSCNGKYQDDMKEVVDIVDKAGYDYTYHRLIDQDDAFIAEKSQGADYIVIGGGDGTVNRVINATYEMDIPYILLPFGSGNDFARTYVGSKYRKDIIETIENGKTEEADLWLLNGSRVFVQSMVLGLSIMTIEIKTESRSSGYVGPILKALRRYVPETYHIETPEKTVDTRCLIIAIENSPSSCGGLKFCEHSKTDDGIMEVIVCPSSGKVRTILTLVSCIKGWLNRQPHVDVIKTQQVRVTGNGPLKYTVDGDIRTSDEIRVEKMDRKIRIRYL